MKAQILIIDDEESIRYTIESFLTDEGYSVVTACGCNDAIRKIRSARFDMILADISLEDGTGIDILREAKDADPNSVVIMMTGYPDVETAADAVRLGAFDYLCKPVTQDKILHTTNKGLKHRASVDKDEKHRSNLEAIFRSVRDAIITVDKELAVVQINEAAIRRCGFPGRVTGQPFRSMPKGCNAHCIEVLEETFRRRQPVEKLRMECNRAGSPKYIVNLNCYPLRDAQGDFDGVVMVSKEDTQLADPAPPESGLSRHRSFHRIVGQSEKMQRVYSLIENLADMPTTVLITGESGTGKELVAEALHCSGKRGKEPLVKVNCSALPESLLESELFGHVKGAFTGAFQDKIGRFQRADGGTIFLDEIGDISPKIQLALLRVLQEGEIERVGDPTPVKIDVRVVAATNRALRNMVRSGQFREDLFYRLKVVEVSLPPLRERREDITALIDHFLSIFNKRFNRKIKSVSADVEKFFMTYSWPGNVRELEHALEHAFVLCRNCVITVDDLPPEFGADLRTAFVPFRGTKAGDSRSILEALAKTGWNKAKAARILGIDRKTLYRKMNHFGLYDEACHGLLEGLDAGASGRAFPRGSVGTRGRASIPQGERA